MRNLLHSLGFLALLLTAASPSLFAVELGKHQLWAAKPPSCDDALANTPPPVTALLTTDKEVYLWFFVREANAGDVAASEYYNPAGQLYAPSSGPWPALEKAGNYCFTDVAFPIAGAPPASQPGTWTVRVRWNGKLLFAIRFTISRPGTISQAPVITPGGVVNTADYTAAVAPGAMISLFGTNLAPSTRLADGAPLPLTLNSVSVEIADGARTENAPLFFVSSGQINAQLPFRIQSAQVGVRVRNTQGVSQAATISVRGRAPRVLTRTQDGKGEAILLHAEDYALVSQERPAQPGEYVVLYLTGLGAVTPEPTAGRPGGDGATWGALQQVTQPVEVAIGGKAAVVHFAGLAPGFVGLYQVNLQAPTGLTAGALPLVVRCGSEASQTGVTAYLGEALAEKPEDVVRRAMEAQVRGDTAALMSYAARNGFSQPARQKAAALFETVRRSVAFSNFQFTHLATAPGDKGTLAVVRGLVSVTVSTRDGRHAVTQGFLAFLRKEDGAWKILVINPDELLNLELWQRAQPAKAAASGERTAGTSNLEELNAQINRAMKGGYVNEWKLGLDTYFAGVGQIPVYGDAAANVYQVYDTLSNAAEGVSEIWRYGFTGIALLKVKQVGVGVLQIALEGAPGFDALTDEVQAALEQLGYNLEVLRALNEVREDIRQLDAGQVKVNPVFHQAPLLLFANPAGVEIEAAAGSPTYSYGLAPHRLLLKAATALGKRIPFQVVGEIAIDPASRATFAVLAAGGQERNGRLYFPVDVTHLVEGDVSEGDTILDHYDRYRPQQSNARFLQWDITCRRGQQQLMVRLRNGETTRPLIVDHRVMNEINALHIEGVPDGPISLRLGQPLAGLRVIGYNPTLTRPLQPDLTNYPDCLDMAIRDPAIAELTRSETATLTPRSAGQTRWNLLLAGGLSGRLPELEKSVEVKVEGSPFAWFAAKARVFGFRISGTFTCVRQTNNVEEFCFPNEIWGANSPEAPLKWDGPKFSTKGTLTQPVVYGGRVRNAPIKIDVENGELSPDGKKIAFVRFKWESPGYSMEVSFQNVPLAAWQPGVPGADSTTRRLFYTTSSAAEYAAAVVNLKYCDLTAQGTPYHCVKHVKDGAIELILADSLQ